MRGYASFAPCGTGRALPSAWHIEQLDKYFLHGWMSFQMWRVMLSASFHQNKFPLWTAAWADPGVQTQLPAGARLYIGVSGLRGVCSKPRSATWDPHFSFQRLVAMPECGCTCCWLFLFVCFFLRENQTCRIFMWSLLGFFFFKYWWLNHTKEQKSQWKITWVWLADDRF